MTKKKMIAKRVAILLATFNGVQYLKEQLNSLLDQKAIIFDIYISDDNSTDNTFELLLEYQEKFSNINLLPKRDTQLRSPGLNFYYLLTTVSFDNYDYVALSDQDDIWPEYKISRAVSLLSNSIYDGYSSDFINFYQNKKSKFYKKSNKPVEFDHFFETPGPGCSFVISKKLAKHFASELIDKPNLKDFKYHDWLLYAFARSNSYSWVIDDSPNLFYRQHNNNFVGANTSFHGFYKRIEQILDGSWPNNIWFLVENFYISKSNKLNKNNFTLFFLLNFYKTRRTFSHKILMFPFLILMSMRRL